MLNRGRLGPILKSLVGSTEMKSFDILGFFVFGYKINCKKRDMSQIGPRIPKHKGNPTLRSEKIELKEFVRIKTSYVGRNFSLLLHE